MKVVSAVVVVSLGLAGCGLLLDSDPMPRDAATTDAAQDATFDAQLPDTGTRDASDARPDALVGSDAVVDSVRPVLPVIVSGAIKSPGAAAREAEEAIAPSTPVPFRVESVAFTTSEPMDEGLVAGALANADGIITSTPVVVTRGGGTYIAFNSPLEPLNTGWYCVHIRSTTSVRGPALDGDWLGAFDTGDGVEGGDFVYVFPILVGDADGDQDVDGDDLSIVQDFSDPRGDINGDGNVDGADFLEWQRRVGQTLPALPPTGACPLSL